mgnify:CR=1 FL=1
MNHHVENFIPQMLCKDDGESGSTSPSYFSKSSSSYSSPKNTNKSLSSSKTHPMLLRFRYQGKGRLRLVNKGPRRGLSRLNRVQTSGLGFVPKQGLLVGSGDRLAESKAWTPRLIPLLLGELVLQLAESKAKM